MIRDHLQQLHLPYGTTYVVADSALYSADNLQTLAETGTKTPPRSQGGGRPQGGRSYAGGDRKPYRGQGGAPRRPEGGRGDTRRPATGGQRWSDSNR